MGCCWTIKCFHNHIRLYSPWVHTELFECNIQNKPMCLTITCMDSARRKDSSWVHYVFLKKRKGRLFLLEVVFKLKCICINHMSKLFIFTRNLFPIIDIWKYCSITYSLVILNLQYTCYFLFCVSSLRK